ncbi:MAG: hypothetical protein HC903_17570 [Methylacidiphilales bacterium]|nr:hypothetical protein [Candidatus Methylacidiphilales bacterium]
MVRSLQRTVGLSLQQTAGIISNFQPIESAIASSVDIRKKHRDVALLRLYKSYDNASLIFGDV